MPGGVVLQVAPGVTLGNVLAVEGHVSLDRRPAVGGHHHNLGRAVIDDGVVLAGLGVAGVLAVLLSNVPEAIPVDGVGLAMALLVRTGLDIVEGRSRVLGRDVEAAPGGGVELGGPGSLGSRAGVSAGRADLVAGFSQEGADGLFGLVVLALAEVGVAHGPVLVDEVLGRPVLVAVGT